MPLWQFFCWLRFNRRLLHLTNGCWKQKCDTSKTGKNCDMSKTGIIFGIRSPKLVRKRFWILFRKYDKGLCFLAIINQCFRNSELAWQLMQLIFSLLNLVCVIMLCLVDDFLASGTSSISPWSILRFSVLLKGNMEIVHESSPPEFGTQSLGWSLNTLSHPPLFFCPYMFGRTSQIPLPSGLPWSDPIKK